MIFKETFFVNNYILFAKTTIILMFLLVLVVSIQLPKYLF